MKTKATYHKAALIALTLALAAFTLSGCGNAGGGGQGGGGGGPTITVGSKNFTEQFVLGELYAQTLEANGFTAERQLSLGSEQLADEALQSGEIDFYPEYTGTALVALLGYEGENPLRRARTRRHNASVRELQQQLRHLCPPRCGRTVRPSDPERLGGGHPRANIRHLLRVRRPRRRLPEHGRELPGARRV